MRPAGRLLLPAFCALFLLAADAFATPNLNGRFHSALDPHTATLERRGDQLLIRIRQRDGSVKEIVKQLAEIKPGTVMNHWTGDLDHPSWQRGGLPKSALDRFNTPVNINQSYGPGFYASTSPVDAVNYGDLLTEFELRKRGPGLVGRMLGKKPPEESIWVLREELSFPGSTVAERKKLADQTFALLKKAGISGAQVTDSWFTFFDPDVLTHFRPVDPARILDQPMAERNLKFALEKIRSKPGNAAVWASLEGELSSRITRAATAEALEPHIDATRTLNIPVLKKAMTARMHALLPTLPAGYPRGKFADKFLAWAGEQEDYALFGKMLDHLTHRDPAAWGDPLFATRLSWYSARPHPEALQNLIQEKLNAAVQGAKSAEELHVFLESVRRFGSEAAKDQAHARSVQLLKAGAAGRPQPADWAYFLSHAAKPDPAIAGALAEALQSGQDVDWGDPLLRSELHSLLQRNSVPELRPALSAGLSSALRDPAKFPSAAPLASLLSEDPAIRSLLLDAALAHAEKITEAEARALPELIDEFDRIRNWSPEELRQLLLRLRNGLPKKGIENSSLAHEILMELVRMIPQQASSLQSELLNVALGFLAELQSRMPPGQSITSDAKFSAFAIELMNRAQEGDIEKLPSFAHFLEDPVSTSCPKGFQALGTKLGI